MISTKKYIIRIGLNNNNYLAPEFCLGLIANHKKDFEYIGDQAMCYDELKKSGGLTKVIRGR